MFEGEQLLFPIQKCMIACGCVGNHDIDVGVDVCTSLNKRSGFPWLLSNLHYKDGSSIVGSKDFHILEKNGLRFGVIGLAEFGWITTLNCLDLNEVDYEDFITKGTELAKMLKETLKCDFVIALTHMRIPNDQLLGQRAEHIDIILGGHDHVGSH